MDMKKWQRISAGFAALCAVGVADSATIQNVNGQSCGGFSGNWHFINNQLPKSNGAATLFASWTTGETCTVLASKVLTSTQHFNCTAGGTLISAYTLLSNGTQAPGNLVLSDFSCETKEPPPPPPPCGGKGEPECPKP